MKDLSKKAFQGLAQFAVILWLSIFLPAWSLQYWQGWIYWLVFLASILYITAYFLKNDPELIMRRMNVGVTAEKQKSQKIIQAIAGLCFVGLMIGSAIDHRLHPSQVSPLVVYLSDLLTALGFFIIFYVFKENSFTSSIIEVDKKQSVISTGPYAVIRHPMYFGALFLFFFTPFALDSHWGLVFSVLLTISLIVRLLDEEKYLIKHLHGYPEYLQKVKYRLIPFLW